MSKLRRVIETFDFYLEKLLSFGVVSILLGMLGFAFLQVILRNFFDAGIPWVDVVLRNLVLWVGMLGGALATRRGRQISIDLFSRFSNRKLKSILAWVTGVFTIVVCLYLSRASLQFVAAEKEFETMLYGEMPIWYIQIILPLGFAIIGIEVLLNLFLGRVEGADGIETVAAVEVSGNEDTSEAEDNDPPPPESEETTKQGEE